LSDEFAVIIKPIMVVIHHNRPLGTFVEALVFEDPDSIDKDVIVAMDVWGGTRFVDIACWVLQFSDRSKESLKLSPIFFHVSAARINVLETYLEGIGDSLECLFDIYGCFLVKGNHSILDE
jgi:hypothetical protein